MYNFFLCIKLIGIIFVKKIKMLRIKEILKEKKISQIELSEILETTTVGLNKIINGNPTAKTLIKIANALDVDVRDLLASTKINDSQPLYIKDQNGNDMKVGYLINGVFNSDSFSELRNKDLDMFKKLDDKRQKENAFIKYIKEKKGEFKKDQKLELIEVLQKKTTAKDQEVLLFSSTIQQITRGLIPAFVLETVKRYL